MLFVTVFARTLIFDILQKPAELIELLGKMLPKSSTTISNYVILQAFVIYPAQMLLAGPIILTWIGRLYSWNQNTPRKISDAYYPSVLTCLNYGIVYPLPILIFVIGLVYSCISPIILPFCAIFFAMGKYIHNLRLLCAQIHDHVCPYSQIRKQGCVYCIRGQ